MKIESKYDLELAPVNMSMGFDVGCDLANRASPERLRKGNDFRLVEGVLRLQGPLAALRRSGEIGDVHVAAANRWYRDYVLGVEGARDPDAVRSGKARDFHAGMLARVAACARHRGVRDALGLCAEIRLRLFLADELSFSSIAEKLMPKDVNGRKKIAAQLSFLLEQLAEHYENVDRERAPPRSLTRGS